jgi:hypothetical protein
MPKPDPHPSLDFEEGEVIYENTRLMEWYKFWNLTGLSMYAFMAMFVPYSLLYKTHMPLSHAYDNVFLPYYQHSMFFFDNNGAHIPVVGGIALCSSYYLL